MGAIICHASQDQRPFIVRFISLFGRKDHIEPVIIYQSPTLSGAEMAARAIAWGVKYEREASGVRGGWTWVEHAGQPAYRRSE